MVFNENYMTYETQSGIIQALSLFPGCIYALITGHKKLSLYIAAILPAIAYFIGQFVLPVNQPPCVFIGFILLPVYGIGLVYLSLFVRKKAVDFKKAR
jgi:hypothetical protein